MRFRDDAHRREFCARLAAAAGLESMFDANGLTDAGRAALVIAAIWYVDRADEVATMALGIVDPSLQEKLLLAQIAVSGDRPEGIDEWMRQFPAPN